jgi:hypothetical protein
MIGKILKGKSFKACLGYVLGKEEARIIDGNVIGDDPSQLSRQFDWHCQSNDSVKRVVYHLILSTSPEENLTDQQWRAIAKDYLSALNLTDVPYLIVQHTDRPHQHLHLVTTRIKSDGTCVRDGWDYTRSQKIIKVLEEKYQLKPKPSQPIKSEDEKETLELIKRSLDELFIKYESLSLDEIIRLLAEQNIQVSIKRTPQKKTIKNLFYEFNNVTFIDLKLGKDYTLSELERKGSFSSISSELNHLKKNHTRDLHPDEVAFNNLFKSHKNELKVNNFKFNKNSREYTLSYGDKVLIRYITLAKQRALILYQHPHYEQYLSSFKSSLNQSLSSSHSHQRSR